MWRDSLKDSIYLHKKKRTYVYSQSGIRIDDPIVRVA
jgi:hypothetical protein